MRNTVALVALLLSAPADVPAANTVAVPVAVAAAVADHDRPAAQVSLDRWRRPAELIAFAGLRRGTEASEWLLTGSNRRHSPCKGCPAAQAANLGYKAVWQLSDSVGDELIENLWAGRPLQASSTEEHG